MPETGCSHWIGRSAGRRGGDCDEVAIRAGLHRGAGQTVEERFRVQRRCRAAAGVGPLSRSGRGERGHMIVRINREMYQNQKIMYKMVLK